MNQLIAKLKSAHKSVQVWFNGMLTSVAIGLTYASDNFPTLKDYVSTSAYKHIMIALILGNLIIHFRPTQRSADKADSNAGDAGK